ncbi:uncharacterized protein TNCV_2125071 [Trichonephila clavipes]|nr:uncharacterized protein TNCV_2125071 [Trichonephila clavipes]
MRTVFNASSPSTSGKSLNSIQFNGGLVQEDLFPLWFARKHKYAFTTDIEKMFRMINIHPGANVLAKNSVEEGHRRANKNVRVNYSNLRHNCGLLELMEDELPFKEIVKEWRRFIDSLKAVNNISIDRSIVIHRAESIELHAFSDASEKAYGSSIYLKSISALGEVKVSRNE